MKLGYLALLTSQGVPYMQGGEEFARTKGGNNNSYDAPDAVNEVDWSLKRQALRSVQRTCATPSRLRKAHPVFRLRTREEVAARLKFEDTPGSKTLVYTFDAAGLPGETWKHACVALNSGDDSVEVKLPEGQWQVALNEHGAADLLPVAGAVNVRAKSGLVLYQR